MDIEELRELAKSATPGEWRAGTTDTDCVFGDINNPELMAPYFGRVLLRTNHHFPAFEADARFIAAMRNSFEPLLQELTELRAVKLRIRERIAIRALDGGPSGDTLAEIERLTR